MAERYNAAVAFVDRHLTEGRAEKVAFRDPRRSLSYGELHDQASRVGPALAALGIAPEHRVVMLMLDTVDFPVVFWGAIRAGIIPVPLNTLLGPDQYAYVLEDSRAPLVVVSAPLLPAVEAAIAASGRRVKVVVAGAEPGSTKHPRLDDLLTAAAPAAEPAATCADEVAFWLYSSGSTGMPKGVKHVHSSLIETARLYGAGRARHRRGRRRLLGGEALLRLRPRQRHELPDGGRRHRRAARRAADAEIGGFGDEARAADDLLRRADALCRHAGRPGLHAGERLAAPAPLRLGRRSAARACRARLEEEVRRRHPRRHRLDRDAAHLSHQRRRGICATAPRAAPSPATSCASSTRPAARSASARSARCWCAGPRTPRATGTSARSRAAPSRAPGPAPATNTSARPTGASSAAAALTTCSRSQASGSRPSRSRRR